MKARAFLVTSIQAVWVALVFVLAGCAGMTEPIHAPVVVGNESPQAKAVRLAHVAIDEANAMLIALNSVIADNAQAGVWTKPQAKLYSDRADVYGERVDRARDALRLGDLTSAVNQAEFVKTLILTLHKKVAAQARKDMQ